MKNPFHPIPGFCLLGLACVGSLSANETLVIPIVDGNDDVEEVILAVNSGLAAGAIDQSSSDLELTHDSSWNGTQYIGLRFRDVQIPQGTPIVSAYVQFGVDETGNSDAFSVRISGEDADDSAPFTGTAFEVSSRTRTTSSVDWTDAPAWTTIGVAGPEQRTADIASVIQEIVDRPGWASGNALSLILEGLEPTSKRVAESYDGSTALAPQLVVVLPTSETYQVAMSSDDVEEENGVMYLDSSDLEITEDSLGSPQKIGIRFANAGIPKGAVVLSAHLQFAQDSTKNGRNLNVSIYGLAEDAPATFTLTNNDLSNRPKTAASVNWIQTVPWTIKNEAGPEQRTPDVSTILHEIIDRPGYEEGNPIGFVLEGEGQREAESYDGDATLAPRLVVTYIGEKTAPSSDLIRLVWNNDPATTMTIGWRNLRGEDPHIMMGTDPLGADWTRYNLSTITDYYNDRRDPDVPSFHLVSHFADVSGLSPDTAYYFAVVNSEGVSETMWFKTAPNTPSSFTFITGGDARTNNDPREWGNQLVAKIRPLFIAYNGDYMNDGTYNEWLEWLTEWSTMTRSEDGRMYPLLPVHGNHENDVKDMLRKIFHVTNPDVYSALSIGGSQMRVVTLNTELEPGVGYGAFEGQTYDAWDAQTAWLEAELAAQAHLHTFVFANYHRPLRPHTSGKTEGAGRLVEWGPLFTQYGVDLALESDTHMAKYTYPLVYDTTNPGSFESFRRDDLNGTLFIGEGAWGAPKRPTDDDKPWTLASGSFWHFQVVQATPEQLTISTIAFESEADLLNTATLTQEIQDADPLALPAGANYWNPLAGEIIVFHATNRFTGADVNHHSVVTSLSDWKYLDTGATLPESWTTVGYNDSAWSNGQGQLGYGDGDENQVLSFGANPSQKITSYFFRQKFTVADVSTIVKAYARIVRDDGAVIYVNGQEVARTNMPDGPISNSTFAIGAVGGASESQYYEFGFDPDVLVNGENVIAVRVHQSDLSSSDLSFDLDLSLIESMVVGDAPAAPGDLAVTPLTTSTLEVTWTDNADNETGFELYRKVGADGQWKLYRDRLEEAVEGFYFIEGNTRRIAEAQLAEGTEYFYQVRAYNKFGRSAKTDVASATTLVSPVATLFAENFENGNFGLLTTVDVGAPDKNWNIGTFSGNRYANHNAYQASAPADDWLILPPFHFGFYEDETFSFETISNYSDTIFGLTLLYSTDYDPLVHSDPRTATWTSLNDALTTEGTPIVFDTDFTNFGPFLPSGDLDLSGIAFDHPVTLAFRYQSGNVNGSAHAWEVDNLIVRGNYAPPQLFSEDFDSQTLGGMTQYSRSSTGSSNSGLADWHPQLVADRQAAFCEGFGADAMSDDWLITPAMNIAPEDNAVLNFDYYTRYRVTADHIEVLVSNDYTGSGDPLANGTWSPLAVPFDPLHDNVWLSYQEISLGGVTGPAVYVAFRYRSVGTGSGQAPRTGVDNVSITKSLAPPALTVDFVANRTILHTNLPVEFTPIVANAREPVQYLWNFGDGNTSTMEKPAHTYGTAGIYTVELTVTDADNDTATEIKQAFIEVKNDIDISEKPARLRIATFNAFLNRASLGGILADVSNSDSQQIRLVAEIVQRANPDILFLNEFDYVAGGEAVQKLIQNYFNVSQNGQNPIDFPYYFVAESNTGIQPESVNSNWNYDFDNNGSTNTGNDAFGFGEFPGQYAMAILSKYPIDTAAIRTFQKFRWMDMTGAKLPADPLDSDGNGDTTSFFNDAEKAIFRLSSKSHWDVPILVAGETIHILGSHPTPPVFDDGTDTDGDPSTGTLVDWNGFRNHDEIKFWADYVNPAASGYIYDDAEWDAANPVAPNDPTQLVKPANPSGGLPANTRFVIMGDQNADADEGDATGNPIANLIETNPFINTSVVPTNDGLAPNKTNSDTASFGLRADYVLPSTYGWEIEDTGVFFPQSGDPRYYLVANDASSDHRLVWVDLNFQVADRSFADYVAAENLAAGTPAEDNDGDLEDNFTEYGFAQSSNTAGGYDNQPQVVLPTPVAQTPVALPRSEASFQPLVTMGGSTKEFRVVYRRVKNDALTWTVFGSADLVAWNTLTEGVDYTEASVIANLDGTEDVSLKFSSSGDRYFVEIRGSDGVNQTMADPTGWTAIAMPGVSEVSLSVPFCLIKSYSGLVAGVSGQRITLNGFDFTTLTSPHYLVVTSGPLEGASAVVTQTFTDGVQLDDSTGFDFSALTVGADAVEVIPAWTLSTLFAQANPGDRVHFTSGQGINQPVTETYLYDSVLGWQTEGGAPAGNVWVAPGEVLTYYSAQAASADFLFRGCVPMYKQLVVLYSGPAGETQDVPFGLMSPVPAKLGDLLGASSANGALLNNRDFLLVPANQSSGSQKGAAMVLVYWFGWGWYNGSQPMSDYQLVPGWGYQFRKASTTEPEAVIIEIAPAYLP